MAVAAARFVEGLVDGLKGKNNVKCAYVRSDAVQGLDYFSTPLQLGVSFCFLSSWLIFINFVIQSLDLNKSTFSQKVLKRFLELGH